MCKEACECRLSHSSFAGEDEDLVFYLRQSFSYDRDVGIWAFRRGGTDLLVRTAGTSITLSSFLGFGSRAVFWEKD